jgi:hypothetical protein
MMLFYREGLRKGISKIISPLFLVPTLSFCPCLTPLLLVFCGSTTSLCFYFFFSLLTLVVPILPLLVCPQKVDLTRECRNIEYKGKVFM